jgi:hypothetical protein
MSHFMKLLMNKFLFAFLAEFIISDVTINRLSKPVLLFQLGLP